MAGSMGPTGELMEPLGTLTMDGAKASFAEQARALKAGGVDFGLIETMSALEEVQAAVEGARGGPAGCRHNELRHALSNHDGNQAGAGG